MSKDRMSTDHSIRQTSWALLGATSVCVALLAPTIRPLTGITSDFILLGALALLAELWPVSIFRQGLRITFTLPFLVGIAVHCGPGYAVGTDIVVSLASAVSLRLVSKHRFGREWILINVLVAAMSSALAGCAWMLVQGSTKPIGFGFLFAVAAFVMTYSVSNYAAVAAIDRHLHRRTVHESVLQNWRPNLQILGLYVLVAVLVAFLSKVDLTAYAALTLLPIAALRHAIKAHAKFYAQYFETITTLSMMLQRAHPYTHGHLKRVAAVAEEVALRLGLSSRRAQWVREAAILHDIGKIAIDESVLDKPDRLTDSEYEHVKQHAAFGAQILTPVEAFQPFVRWIRHHHERPDGTGYPDQLSDSEIPIESKIIAVVDAFDAMTGDEKRAYRDPMSRDEALNELDRWADRQFDRNVVDAFRAVVTGGSV